MMYYQRFVLWLISIRMCKWEFYHEKKVICYPKIHSSSGAGSFIGCYNTTKQPWSMLILIILIRSANFRKTVFWSKFLNESCIEKKGKWKRSEECLNLNPCETAGHYAKSYQFIFGINFGLHCKHFPVQQNNKLHQGLKGWFTWSLMAVDI